MVSEGLENPVSQPYPGDIFPTSSGRKEKGEKISPGQYLNDTGEEDHTGNQRKPTSIGMENMRGTYRSQRITHFCFHSLYKGLETEIEGIDSYL